MEKTGIKRDIDELGRFGVPKELQKRLGLKTFEILVDGENLYLKKIDVEFCCFCTDKKDLITYKNKRICAKCLDKIKKL